MSQLDDKNAQIEELRAECQKYILELARKDNEIARLTAHIDELRLQIVSRQGLGSLLRQVYNVIDNSIMDTINTRGLAEHKGKKGHPAISFTEHEDAERLLSKIKEYDIKEFFVFKPKPPASPLKPHYRVAAKVYRTLRDTSHSLVGRARRSTRRLKK